MTGSNDDKGGRRPGRPGGPSGRGGAGGRGTGTRSGGKPWLRADATRAPADAARPSRPDGAGAESAPLPDMRAVTDAGTSPAVERIAKVIARAGVASRRDAEAMIAEGRVTLNGASLTSPAVNVGPDDAITVDGEPLPIRERTRLWLFHKPRGLVTTFRDPEGRPTVFDALPEDMPRVVAIGRLDINTEGLLLLTNDGGLAKVIAQPATGWTRRYRVRAHGDTTQAELDKLGRGITIDGIDYGAIEAHLDRAQGDNIWLTLALREGKNREVKRVLEHVGIQVNRLIRLSFGPFQLGELEQGLVEEVRTRVLKDQLGAALAEEAGVDFESPVREPIAPFGRAERGPPARPPRPRSAPSDDRYENRRPPPRPSARPDARSSRDDRAGGTPRERGAAAPSKRKPVWRAEAGEDSAERQRRPPARRDDPKGDRVTSASRSRERIGRIDSPDGRRVLVERVVANGRDAEDRPARPPRRDGPGRPPRASDGPRRSAGPARERPARDAANKGSRPGKPPFAGRAGDRPERSFAGDKRGGAPAGRSRPPGAAFRPAGSRPGGSRPGGRPPGGPPPKGRGR